MPTFASQHVDVWWVTGDARYPGLAVAITTAYHRGYGVSETYIVHCDHDPGDEDVS